MSKIDTLFVTKIYRAMLRGRGVRTLNEELANAAFSIAGDDTAGQAWSKQKGYAGYTSYASLNDLAWRAPEFAELGRHLDEHMLAFTSKLDFDLGGQTLELDSLWINILEPGGAHSAHIHPHSVISGTYYVAVPDGAGAIRFEDPRHAMMMAAPPRKQRARLENRSFVEVAPKPGMVVMWESWLRHDVPRNGADEPRISISFNYSLPG
jgi:uncharacterized protein (TIGR02466 family)